MPYLTVTIPLRLLNSLLKFLKICRLLFNIWTTKCLTKTVTYLFYYSMHCIFINVYAYDATFFFSPPKCF